MSKKCPGIWQKSEKTWEIDQCQEKLYQGELFVVKFVFQETPDLSLWV